MYALVTSLYLNGNHTQRQRQKRLDTRLKKLVDKKQMLFLFGCFAVVFCCYCYCCCCAGFILKRVFNCLPCYCCCLFLFLVEALTTISWGKKNGLAKLKIVVAVINLGTGACKKTLLILLKRVFDQSRRASGVPQTKRGKATRWKGSAAASACRYPASMWNKNICL